MVGAVADVPRGSTLLCSALGIFYQGNYVVSPLLCDTEATGTSFPFAFFFLKGETEDPKSYFPKTH